MVYFNILLLQLSYSFAVDRSKVDVNRDIDEAAQGDPTATEVYNDFHNYIEGARAIIGRGILFDIHGQVRNIHKNRTKI